MTEGCSEIRVVRFTRNYPWSCSKFQRFTDSFFCACHASCVGECGWLCDTDVRRGRCAVEPLGFGSNMLHGRGAQRRLRKGS